MFVIDVVMSNTPNQIVDRKIALTHLPLYIIDTSHLQIITSPQIMIVISVHR